MLGQTQPCGGHVSREATNHERGRLWLLSDKVGNPGWSSGAAESPLQINEMTVLSVMCREWTVY